MCTEHLRTNMYSPKQKRRRKFPTPPPNRSPIIEALFKGAKLEKKDNPDNDVCIPTKATHPSFVVRKLFALDGSSDHSLILEDYTCTENIEKKGKCPIQTRSPLVENGRECKMDCMDLELTGSDLSKWGSTSENDSLNKESVASCYKQTVCSKALQPGSDSPCSQLSLETHCRKRQVKEKRKQSKQQSFDSGKKDLGSTFPNQDTRNILKERSCLTSQESFSDESSSVQVSKAAFCSRWTSDKTVNRGKSQPCPLVYTNSTTLSRISKHKECPEKQKRISLEAEQTGNNTFLLCSKNTDQVVSSLSEKWQHVAAHESSSDLHKLNNKGSGLKACTMSRKQSVFSSEEEISDSSDEELLPLEKILAQSSTSSGKNPGQINDEDIITDTVNLSHSVSVSYINQMDHLLKEKEEFSRINELEQQGIKWETEIEFLLEEQSNDGELTAEHREFLEKYSVIDGIPDQHPGENIFQIVYAGKIFHQYNLDLRNFGFHPQNPIEKYILGSEITQQLFVVTEGLLVSAYHTFPCPAAILKWMFQMMSVHPDCSVSRKVLHTLMTLTIQNSSTGSDEPRLWIPSLFDIAVVLMNLGVPFSVLFPLQNFQPSFTEDDIRSEIPEPARQQPSGNIFGDSFPFFFLIETNLCNIAKFLRLCISICGEGYTQKEIFMLLLLLFKLSLEKELKRFPLVDLQCLIIKLLENIGKWDTKMSELCLAINSLSSHHHDLLWLVQFVPDWTARGRQVRRHLSLVIISKLLENHVDIPSSHDQQMSLLCKELVMMKPSNLIKKHLEISDDGSELSKESFISELEPKAYYMLYVLLHLVREASSSESTNLIQKKWLLKLCSTLEKHIKCNIREDARLLYKTKVSYLLSYFSSSFPDYVNRKEVLG
ncbi:SMC5-SMC6 complex localization factor protein 2 isoform X2 [Sceloporus undulatus]|nr:SMC5-SMC6 complex localization factor protein 2 isoform X2 [Sceloporus undulatus]